jgi:hypothetical protein
MAALLGSLSEVIEETQGIGRYSRVEGEILVLFRRPARFPSAFKEILRELTPLFSEHEIWKGILDLIQDGMVRAAYTSGYEIGLEWV